MNTKSSSQSGHPGERLPSATVLGDRYRALSLLGSGAFGSVWLAIDEGSCDHDATSSPRYVALKVNCGDPKPQNRTKRRDENEEETLRRLMEAAPGGGNGGGSGRLHIIEMFDAFDLRVAEDLPPRRCLVLEVACGDLRDMVNLEPRSWSFEDRLAVFAQCVCAVEYMHSLGLTHGDLDVANFVLAAPHLSSLSEDEFVSELEFDPRPKMDFAAAMEYMRGGGKANFLVPEACGLDKRKRDWRNLFVKLIDFGEAFTGESQNVATHGVNCPLELISKKSASSASDIWALGCILWHLILSRPLMLVFSKQPKKGQRVFSRSNPGRRRMQLYDLLEEMKLEGLHLATDVEEQLVELSLDMLAPDPSKRPTATAVLASPLFSSLGSNRVLSGMEHLSISKQQMHGS